MLQEPTGAFYMDGGNLIAGRACRPTEQVPYQAIKARVSRLKCQPLTPSAHWPGATTSLLRRCDIISLIASSPRGQVAFFTVPLCATISGAVHWFAKRTARGVRQGSADRAERAVSQA